MSSGGGGFLSNGIKQASNLVGDFTGSNRTADAYSDAAGANLAQQRSDRQQALGFAAPTDAELTQLQQSITQNNQEIGRKQKMLDSVDPAFLEAGHQALALMQGKSSPMLAPLANQRAQQRSSLEQNLAKQLGPDYATSTAGIQALNNFDQQTSNLTTQTQQQTLGDFMGYASQGEQFGNLQPNISNSAGFANYYGSIGSRQANAITGNRIDPGQGYLGDIMRGTNQQQFTSQLYQNAKQGIGMSSGNFGSMFGGNSGGQNNTAFGG